MLPPDDILLRIYLNSRTIAVVGASGDESKPAHTVPLYLQAHGYRIVPVNPFREQLFGERCLPSLRDVDVQIDVVDVFRPSDETPDVARDAAAIGAKVLWLQEGIHSDEAAEVAARSGLIFVSDACMRSTHRRLAT